MRLYLLILLMSGFLMASPWSLSRHVKCLKHFESVTRLYRYVRGQEKPQLVEDQTPVKKYLPAFFRVYFALPPQMQKMYCHLSEVLISDGERNDTARTHAIYDKNERMIGAKVEFDREILDRKMSLKSWATWKEQLSFGGIRHLNDSLSWLPRIDTNLDDRVDGFIYYLIAHEFGHIFDFANDINDFRNDVNGNRYAATEWSQFSWMREKVRKKESNFSLVEKFCFYNCKEGEHIPVSKTRLAYRGLRRSDFITAYGATDHFDDWAETVAFWALDYLKDVRYIVDLEDDGETFHYDVMIKYNSDVFEKKRKFVKDFFKGQIKYPEVAK